MALPATDAFTDANGTNLTAHSAGGVTWSSLGGSTIEVQSNMASPASSGSGPHYYDSGNTYNNDQYAFVVLGNAAGTGGQIGPAVRASAAGGGINGYYYEIASAGREFYKRTTSGGYVGLGNNTTANTAADGDIARLEVSGNTLTPLYNGVADSGIAPGGAVSDSTIGSGSGGLGGWYDAVHTPVRANSWEAGNLGGGGAAAVASTLMLTGVGS